MIAVLQRLCDLGAGIVRCPLGLRHRLDGEAGHDPGEAMAVANVCQNGEKIVAAIAGELHRDHRGLIPLRIACGGDGLPRPVRLLHFREEMDVGAHDVTPARGW